MRTRRRRASYPKSGSESFQTINITPFTDVLLVLVIIFLIAGSSLVSTGLEIDELAGDGGAESTLEEKSVGVLYVDADGSLTYLASGEVLTGVQIDDLRKEIPIDLTSGESTPSERVIEVYDDLLRSGFTKVRLARPQERLLP